MLYRSTDRLRRRGASMKNLAHSASFHSTEKIAPSKAGIKHVGPPAPPASGPPAAPVPGAPAPLGVLFFSRVLVRAFGLFSAPASSLDAVASSSISRHSSVSLGLLLRPSM